MGEEQNIRVEGKFLKRLTAGFLLAVLIVIATGFAYYHEESINIPASFAGFKRKTKKVQHVQCEVVANIGARYILKMGISIPSHNKKQFDEIKEKLPRIQSEFLTTLDSGKMDDWIRNRDYEAIKRKFLHIVNRYSDRPVQNIYFNSFNYF